MYLLEERNIPSLAELLKDISSIKEFKSVVHDHLQIVNEVTADEFQAYEDPMKYIELRDYVDAIEGFMRLLR
ncbi:hypothetical protein [Lacihabitans soyangensis]|uniref:Uncharacterized protein n=1 Tax=Lacihabitans soyangensis TaxID=869394 RepID=A0AAE3KU25_9BACT|nr:hypothetical protein [Lacihabitans soyangensis]MCP9765142.1 hypothetical protein [Lacihabitans soyangensis]